MLAGCVSDEEFDLLAKILNVIPRRGDASQYLVILRYKLLSELENGLRL